MTVEQDNIATIEAMMKAFNAHDPEGIRPFVTDDFEWVVVAREEVTTDVEEMVESDRAFFAKFPDLDVQTTNLFASGDFVALEWLAHGTNTGPWDEETPATGKEFTRRGCSIAEMKDGKIRRYRDYFDRAQMLRPLGLMQFI